MTIHTINSTVHLHLSPLGNTNDKKESKLLIIRDIGLVSDSKIKYIYTVSVPYVFYLERRWVYLVHV